MIRALVYGMAAVVIGCGIAAGGMAAPVKICIGTGPGCIELPPPIVLPKPGITEAPLPPVDPAMQKKMIADWCKANAALGNASVATARVVMCR